MYVTPEMAMGYSGWHWALLGTLIHVLRISATKTDIYTKLGNKRFQDAMAASETKSALSCCTTCHRTEGCLLVSHNAQTRQCELHGFEIGDDSKILPDPGWDVYYNTRDDCENAACQNLGTCQDSIGTYTCLCPTGFEGQHCELDVRCPSGWSLVGNACYYFDMSLRTWSSAQQNCNGLGSELISIKTATQNNDVIGLIETLYPNIATGIWLGGYFNSGINALVWDDDNTPVSAGFEFWNTNEPSGAGTRCIMMLASDQYGYRWNDCQCSDYPKKSICKKDATV